MRLPVTDGVVKADRHTTFYLDAGVPSGHWMAQEKPHIVNAALAGWLATELPSAWPIRPHARA